MPVTLCKLHISPMTLERSNLKIEHKVMSIKFYTVYKNKGKLKRRNKIKGEENETGTGGRRRRRGRMEGGRDN